MTISTTCCRLTGDQTWISSLSSYKTAIYTELYGFARQPSTYDIPWRVLRDHLIYFVVDGTCLCETNREATTLDAGTLMWMAPGVRHRLYLNEQRDAFTVYNLRFRLRHGDNEFAYARDLTVARDAWELRPMVEQLYEEMSRGQTPDQVRMRALLTVIATSLLRTPVAGGQGSTLSHAQRRRLTQFVARDPAERISPADLAEQLNLSPDYFTRLFRKTFGIPPRTWLLQQRMQRAATHLDDTTQTITQIAQALGYEDVYLFSRQFKQATGRSPRAYRNRRESSGIY